MVELSSLLIAPTSSLAKLSKKGQRFIKTNLKVADFEDSNAICPNIFTILLTCLYLSAICSYFAAYSVSSDSIFMLTESISTSDC